MPVELVTTNVSGKGTLLQDAIQSNKQDFVRILLEYGVDPTAISDVKQATPLDIALELEDLEVLHILSKFMEMPDYVKLIQLALLVNSDKADESNEEFHRILHSLPVDMVSTTRPRQCGRGTILQDGVQNGKLDIVRDLLEFGVDPTAVCKENRGTPLKLSMELSGPEMRRLLGE